MVICSWHNCFMELKDHIDLIRKKQKLIPVIADELVDHIYNDPDLKAKVRDQAKLLNEKLGTDTSIDALEKIIWEQIAFRLIRRIPRI